MIDQSYMNASLTWATKIAAMVNQAADEFGAEVDALEKKWARRKRIEKVFPKGVMTIDNAFCVLDVTVNVEVMDYKIAPPEKDIGFPGGIYDLDYVLTNYNGRAMPWLEKYVTPKQNAWVWDYVCNRAHE